MTSPTDDDNPFAPPEALIGDRATGADLDFDADAELIRRHHLAHESSIKSVGLLCYLASFFGVLVVIGGSLAAVGATMAQAPPGASVELIRITMWVGVAIWGVVAVLGFAQGYGLRALQVWARWMGIVLTSLAMIGSLFCGLIWLAVFPMPDVLPLLVGLGGGLAIESYLFYLLVAPKSNMVFSGEYRLVIDKTPAIRSRTSLIVKLGIGLLLALIVLGLLGMIASSFR